MQKNAAIIGFGATGQQFGRILQNVGWDITGIDKGGSPELVKGCSLVVIAVFPENIKELKWLLDYIEPGTLVVSAMGMMGSRAFILEEENRMPKRYLCLELCKKEIELAFIHILCAPDMDLQGENVLLCLSECSEENGAFVRRLFTALLANVVETGREEHDEEMADAQRVLRELAFAYVLDAVSKGKSLERRIAFSPRPTRAFLAMVCRFALQPEHLNLHILTTLPSSTGIIGALADVKASEWLAKKGKPERLKTILAKAREWVIGKLGRALALSINRL